jgi:2-polyprenyl-3-methyl-5-hydroxy-6-metoxy-1,4-benzoquinol methylase
MAASQHTANQPNPLQIFDALNAYQQTAALRTAIELDVFTHIGAGAITVRQIASKATASEKGIRILCDYLVIQNFLGKHDSSYSLLPTSAAFLDKRSPAYMGSIAFFLAHPTHVAHYTELTAAVRRGGTADDQGNMGPDDPIWVEFAKYMAPMSAMASAELARIVNIPDQPMKVLDIAAGPGAWGIEVAKLNPKAEVYAQDWKNVLELSMENAQRAGVSERYHAIPGSAFDVDLGADYDLILLPNFVHHFDHDLNVKLLKRLRAALKPDGRLATMEFVPNPDRISPLPAAAFSMMMLGSTASGDAYTFTELESMFHDAGFGESTAQPLGPQTLILTRN